MDPAGEGQFAENMGAKRRRKVKGGRATAEDAATASEGGQKLSTQYNGAAETNHPKYVLLSVGGKVRVDKNGGERGSVEGGGSGGVP